MPFTIKTADVFYGVSRYPLNGLPPRFQTIESVNDLDLADLADAVGHITSFRRDFTAKYFPEAIYDLPSGKLVIPEHIYARANGYSIRWERAA